MPAYGGYECHIMIYHANIQLSHVVGTTCNPLPCSTVRYIPRYVDVMTCQYGAENPRTQTLTPRPMRRRLRARPTRPGQEMSWPGDAYREKLLESDLRTV
jgi:hypothetical protein